VISIMELPILAARLAPSLVRAQRAEPDYYNLHWKLTEDYCEFLAWVSKVENNFGWTKRFEGPMLEKRSGHKDKSCIYCGWEKQ